MKKKTLIKGGILITVIFIIIFYFEKIYSYNIISLITSNAEKKRIEVTSDYLKTGWMLKNTQNARLAIQPIEVFSLNVDTAKYNDFVENKTYTVDSCMILFGKDNVDKIYFSKKSRGWTWDKICDLKTEKVIEKERVFTFHRRSFYRILSGYWRGDSGYKIFIYVDSTGNFKTFMKPRDGKAL